MPLSEARKKSIKKHLGQFDEFKFRRPKGEKEVVQAHAAAKGMSLNAYINALIDEDMSKGE